MHALCRASTVIPAGAQGESVTQHRPWIPTGKETRATWKSSIDDWIGIAWHTWHSCRMSSSRLLYQGLWIQSVFQNCRFCLLISTCAIPAGTHLEALELDLSQVLPRTLWRSGIPFVHLHGLHFTLSELPCMGNSKTTGMFAPTDQMFYIWLWK